jgi:hypothetical protein
MELSGKYLTYNEYRTLGGTLDETPFNLLEYEARKEIDKETQGRLINLKVQSQDTKMCVFQLISLYQSINNGVDISGNVINYSNEQIAGTISAVIRKYLINARLEDGTAYMYRGIR